MTRTLTFLLLVSCFVGGCSSSQFERSPALDAREPLRVAVLPFMDRASGDSYVSTPWTTLLSLLPILSDDRLTQENAATILRWKFHGNLASTRFELIPLHTVDTQLLYQDVASEALYSGSREEMALKAGALLGADAVVFGSVTAWDRDYYLVEASIAVGLEVDLRETTTGARLFHGEVVEAKRSGVSKIPLDFTPDGAAQSVLLESIKGLRNTQFAVLSDEVSRKIVEELGVPAAARATATPPTIHLLSHDAIEAPQAGQGVRVVALGSPGCRATVRLGLGRPEVMVESSPGTYQVELRPSASEARTRASLRVSLLNKSLREVHMATPFPSKLPRP